MRFYKFLFVILISILFFSSCKNDLNLNAPYKEYPSIFALLNPYEHMQMIRINKVFLGEGNAYDIAKITDSVNYQPNELSVEITHSGGTKISFRDSVIQTAEGAFSTNQRVYVSFEPILTYGTYTLTVKNKNTGNVFTAHCKAIDRVNPNQGYRPLITPFYPYPPGTAIIEYVDYKSYKGVVRFSLLSTDVQIYQMVIRSHYYNNYGAYTTYDFVDYDFGNRYPKDATNFSGGKWLVFEFSSDAYYSSVGIGMSKKPNDANVIGRKMYKIEYLIYASTQEYLDYLEYAKPPLGFNQNKPLYSNFDDSKALGIFAMRTTCSAQKEMATTMVSEFASNLNTCQYSFYDANNQLPGCK